MGCIQANYRHRWGSATVPVTMHAAVLDTASQLGVSRHTPPDALTMLGEAGLLSVRPQRGTFIVRISVKQVFDARFVREAVELAVVRRACTEMTTSGLETLRANLKAQWAVADDPNPERFMDLDDAFHRNIAWGVACEYA